MCERHCNTHHSLSWSLNVSHCNIPNGHKFTRGLHVCCFYCLLNGKAFTAAELLVCSGAQRVDEQEEHVPDILWRTSDTLDMPGYDCDPARVRLDAELKDALDTQQDILTGEPGSQSICQPALVQPQV